MKVREQRTQAGTPEAGRVGCRGGFTLVEILVVVGIIAILAGLIVGLAGRAGESKILKRAEAERDQLVMAIENYKAKLGYYPQDGYDTTKNPPTPPTYSPLYNELTKKRIPDAVKAQFGVSDIANIGPKSEVFLTGLKPTQFQEVPNGKGPRSDDPNVEHTAAQMTYAYGDVPWHYNASSPTNNPGSFDLWVDITIGPKKFTVGNWKD